MRHSGRAQYRRATLAEMGIGTMILFIAMVLVAAVAAAVIISTAGTLQQQAQDTGSEATVDICGGLQILSVIGDRHTDGLDAGANQDNIQLIELRVSLSSGSHAIDFDNLVILVSDGNDTADLALNTSGTTGVHADASHYVATAVRDSDSSWDGNVMTRGDIVKICICADSATNLDLAANTDVSLTIIPDGGAPTYEAFTTPNTYVDRYIDLV